MLHPNGFCLLFGDSIFGQKLLGILRIALATKKTQLFPFFFWKYFIVKKIFRFIFHFHVYQNCKFMCILFYFVLSVL